LAAPPSQSVILCIDLCIGWWDYDHQHTPCIKKPFKGLLKPY
jgi:hypothetical protein